MSGIRFPVDRRWPLGAILGLVLLGGCSSNRETGTQVQETDEMKAQTDEMREMYAGMGERTE